jgi:DNA-binding GntR family transcriptional regulator
VISETSLLGEYRPAPRLSDQTYEHLHDQLVWLGIPPGSPLSEKKLAAELGVGVTPIRDAIKRLSLEHLVIVFPQRGTFAAEVNITDERWLTEVRVDIEGLAAGLAATRASPTERRRLVDELEVLKTKTTQPELTRQDAVIHHAVFTACHNDFLETTLRQYFSLALRMWNFCLDRLSSVDSTDSWRDLEGLVSAIIEGDQQGAQAMAQAHVKRSSLELRAILH